MPPVQTETVRRNVRPTSSPVVERFLAFADKQPDGCWLWTGSIDGAGYGRFTRGRGVAQRLAHRWAYELLVGPIPDGLQLDHLCRVRHCVNPAHLEPVTGRENTLRGTSPSAINALKTHCARGHEFTPANTYVTRDGRRNCRTCRAAASRRYSSKSRAA